MRSSLHVALVAVLWCATSIVFGATPGCGVEMEGAPVVPLYDSGCTRIVPGEYIVAMRTGSPEEATSSARAQVESDRGVVHHRYTHGLIGFSAQIPEAALKALRRNPDVAFIEVVCRGRATGVQTCPPSWGLDRINQSDRPVDGVYSYDNRAEDVDVYVIDSGIRRDHEAFGGASGRVQAGTCAALSCSSANPPAMPDPFAAEHTTYPAWTDCHGHGTHLAAIAGGASFEDPNGVEIEGTDVGVAKGVTLHGVRVTTCDPASPLETDTASLLNGLSWMLGHHEQKRAVALIGVAVPDGGSRALAVSVQRAIDEGIVVVASAGNDGADACPYSPGGAYKAEWLVTPNCQPADPDSPSCAEWTWDLENRAITVGATQDGPQDQTWPMSNHGGCVDVFAPGHSIRSATITACGPAGPCDALGEMSGTSQAAAHVAGVAALLWQKSPAATAQAIASQLLGAALPRVPDANGVLQKHLFSPSTTGSPDPGAPAGACVDGVTSCGSEPCNFCPGGSHCCDGFGCGHGIRCEGGECRPCGRQGDACCVGGVCADPSLVCDPVSGKCQCGGVGEPCCSPPSLPCIAPLSCGASTTCGTCGGVGQPCCGGPGGICNGLLACNALGLCGDCGELGMPCCGVVCGDGLACVGGSCVPCGLVGTVCCEGACEDGLACANGTCVACGGAGQKCCDDIDCHVGFACIGGSCLPCGGPEQPCCEDLRCQNGLACEGWICSPCGAPGQVCCHGNCDDGYTCWNNQCHACGGLSQPCCALGTCGDGMSCTNGICTVCGGAMQPCCAGASCDGDMDCVAGMCRGTCVVRCHEGALIGAIHDMASEAYCNIWSQVACDLFPSGDPVRVEYNHGFIKDTGDCGEIGEACCLASPSCADGECESLPIEDPLDQPWFIPMAAIGGQYFGSEVCE